MPRGYAGFSRLGRPLLIGAAPRGGAFGAPESGVFLRPMPSPPLSDGVSAVLRSDATAALAALMVIAGAHRDIFAWAARMVCGEPPAEAEPPPKLHSNGNGANRVARHPSKVNGRVARGSADSRLAKRDAADHALVEVMKANPDDPLGAWAQAIDRSRSATVSALKRLKAAGLAESVERRWRLVEEPPPKEPPPKWVKPVRGADKAEYAHLT